MINISIRRFTVFPDRSQCFYEICFERVENSELLFLGELEYFDSRTVFKALWRAEKVTLKNLRRVKRFLRRVVK